jgi:hypothetical protein
MALHGKGGRGDTRMVHDRIGNVPPLSENTRTPKIIGNPLGRCWGPERRAPLDKCGCAWTNVPPLQQRSFEIKTPNVLCNHYGP